MKRRRHDLSSVFLTFNVPDAPCKDYAESLTIGRRMFLIGCIQHVMITLCGPVIISYGHIIQYFSSFSTVQVEWMVSPVYQLRSAWTSRRTVEELLWP